MYTLVFWILGCVGSSCDIPGTETMYFETMKDCEVSEIAWKSSSKKHSGACLPGIVRKIKIKNGLAKR